jgi:hypothetical protein
MIIQRWVANFSKDSGTQFSKMFSRLVVHEAADVTSAVQMCIFACDI